MTEKLPDMSASAKAAEVPQKEQENHNDHDYGRRESHQDGLDRQLRSGGDRGASDRNGSFDPAIVKKWQRRSGDVDTIVLVQRRS